MPENTWLLNDSAPVPLAQEFSAAPSEAAWGWFGLPAAGEGSEFAPPVAPWAEHDWLAVLGFQMSAEVGVSTILRQMIVQGLYAGGVL